MADPSACGRNDGRLPGRPALAGPPPSLADRHQLLRNRLNYPLTYWNAEGLVAAVASILLIHLAASEDEHPVVRVLAAIFVPATAATLLLTFSRGALAVGIIGLVVYLMIGRPPALVGAVLALVPTCAIALHDAYTAVALSSSTPTSPAANVGGSTPRRNDRLVHGGRRRNARGHRSNGFLALPDAGGAA